MVVSLVFTVAHTANSIDERVSWFASAGSDNWVPDFVHFARDVAETIGDAVGLSWRAESTRVTNKVISFSTYAFSIFVDLERVAFWNTNAETQGESCITDTALGSIVVS